MIGVDARETPVAGALARYRDVRSRREWSNSDASSECDVTTWCEDDGDALLAISRAVPLNPHEAMQKLVTVLRRGVLDEPDLWDMLDGERAALASSIRDIQTLFPEVVA